MPQEKKAGGWRLLPSIFGSAFLAIGNILIPISLFILPYYIYFYSDLTIRYRIQVLSAFLIIGLVANFIEIGRNKKDVLYQVAWSVYVGAFIGFVSLLSVWMNHVDIH